MRLDGEARAPRSHYEELCAERRAARSRGGGPDPLRRDDACPRAAAAQRRGQLRALAAAGRPGRADLLAGPGAVGGPAAAGRRRRRRRCAISRSAARATAVRCRLSSRRDRGSARPPPAEHRRARRRMRRGARASARRARRAAPRRAPRRRGPIPAASVSLAQPQRIEALSYSSLTALERCGYRYYLERVLGLAEDGPSRAAAATRPVWRRGPAARSYIG